MVKKSKRKQDIKSKLLAAIAMLMVATIMMVSSTYAWFTLSTAPEVQGITTTVGSNGSLEIALSPVSGSGADVTDATLENVTDDWYVKNLTWGNLLDLSDSRYNLAALKLLPAALAMNGNLLGDSPLGTPVYGADGRITGLENVSILGGLDGGVVEKGYAANGDYGVRAVGTVSSQTPQQRMQKQMIAAIKSNASAASGAASSSLSTNGQALATIMVKHAQAGTGDSNNYGEFADDLQLLTADLQASVDYIEAMLVSAMKIAIVTLTGDDYDAAVTALANVTTVDAMETALTEAGVSAPAQLTASIAEWEAIAADVAAAKTAADGLTASATWTDVSGVLNKLMNVSDPDSNAVTINGKTINGIKAIMNEYQELMNLTKNTTIALGEGSGVYYDIAAMTGNIVAKTTATISATLSGEEINVTIDPVIIKTTVTGDTHKDLLVRAGEAIDAVATGDTNIIDTYYGYVLDFMFRTNASGSSLLLQTEGAQRVYEESANEATQGKGSNFTFTTTNADDVNTIIEMCKSLRVAFFDPQVKTVFGIAKATEVTSTEAGGTYTITATLELCQVQTKTVNNLTYADAKNALPDSDPNTAYNDGAVLCALPQNIPTAVSALVYLDGFDISNSDILDKDVPNGTLNLQFASTAELKPMENTDLMNGSTN